MNLSLAPTTFRNQCLYLALFFSANGLIAYAALTPQAQILCGLFGIILPLYAALRTAPRPSPGEQAFGQPDIHFYPAGWILTASILLAIALRFYKLETLFRWPTLDEGWNGTLAVELSKHWTWKFFYTFGEAPPLPVWCAALLLRLGFAPTFCLWFPSAVVSLLTVAAGYFAARQFFEKSPSLVCGGLLAFSYWPLFIGRFCHQGVWLPLWVCLCLFAWGGYLNSPGSGPRRWWSLLLGFALGLGSFTFTPWLAIAALLFGSFAGSMVLPPRKDGMSFSFLTGAFLLALLPFLGAVAREGYGHHIASLSPWGGWFKAFNLPSGFFKYFAVLVWGSFEKDPAYTPLWGGFLNPLLGSFFFLGLIRMFRFRALRWVQWTAAAFFLFLLPGILSPNLESFRIAQVLPLLILITALGLHSFLELQPASKRLLWLGICLAFTAILDFNLLAAPYRHWAAHPENFGRPLKSLERYRAWQVLNEERKKNGPGMILTDFDGQSFNDPTLSFMTYPFNAARNNSLSGTQPSWDAVFVNIHYLPFLQKRFPEGKWAALSEDRLLTDGGNMLGILPSLPGNEKALADWREAHQIFQAVNQARFLQARADFDPLIHLLEIAYPRVQGDPFLESVYWDRQAAFEYEGLHYDQQLYCYQMALTRGYPTAELYQKQGQLLLAGGHDSQAKESFQKAIKAPLDLTGARATLEWLKAKPPGKPADQPEN